MEARSLDETFSICDRDFGIYFKTGWFDEKEYRFYEFLDKDPYHNEYFEISSIRLSEDVDLKPDDRISILLFGENGSLFLVFNHRNSSYHYYPAAVHDLSWSIKERGLFRGFFDGWRLNKAAETFPTSQLFSRILQKVKTSLT